MTSSDDKEKFEKSQKYEGNSISRGVEIQKEVLSHLLGKDPVVVEKRDRDGNITSASLSFK